MKKVSWLAIVSLVSGLIVYAVWKQRWTKVNKLLQPVHCQLCNQPIENDGTTKPFCNDCITRYNLPFKVKE